MAKAIIETSPVINLNICTDEIVRASVNTSGVLMAKRYPVKRICTKIEKQNVYMNKNEEELTDYNTRLVEMNTRVVEVEDDMQEEYLSQVENLEDIRNLFAVKYGKLKKSSGDVWDALKAETEEAWSELEFY